MYALIHGCSQLSFPLGEKGLRLGLARDEGSIPFTRFRPLVPRRLQRGRPRLVAATINEAYPKGESVAP